MEIQIKYKQLSPIHGALDVDGLSRRGEKPCKQGYDCGLLVSVTRRKRRAYYADGP